MTAAAPAIPEQNSRRAWVICLTTALFFLYEFVQLNFFNAINAPLRASLNLSIEQVGSLSAYYLYANIALLFIAGLLLDRFSVKKIILLALSICVIGLLGFSYVHSLNWAKFFYAFTGVGGAVVFLSCIRIASRWFTADRMALITGFIVTMAMLGGVLAQWPLVRLVNWLGWRQSLRVDAILGILILLVIGIVVKDAPASCRQAETTQHKAIHNTSMVQNLMLALKQIPAWLCGLYTCMMNLPISLLGGVWGVAFLVHNQHMTNAAAATLVSMLFWGTIVGSPLTGWLSDRLHQRRLLMIIGAILSIALMLLLMNSSHLSFITLMCLLFGIGLFTSTQILSYPLITQNSPPMLTATCLSVASFIIMGAQGFFRNLYGALVQSHADKIHLHTRIYTAADFHFAMWLFPITMAIACVAVLLTRDVAEDNQKKSKHEAIIQQEAQA